MNQAELVAKIDPFLWKLLPDAERELIEKEMSENAAFRTEVVKRQLENDAIKQLRNNALRAKMSVWREESEAETLTEEATMTAENSSDVAAKETKIVEMTPLRVVKISRMSWAAAAAIALLFVVGGNYWAKNTYGNATLVADFYPKSGDILRGGDDEIFGTNGTGEASQAAVLEAGNTAFDAKNYAEAIVNYEKLTNWDNIASSYMPLAEAHFQLKNYDKAIAVYKSAFDDKLTDNRTSQQAEWKLILTYLAANKTGDDTRFSNLLTRITDNPSHAFYQQALDLKQKTSSFWWKWVN
jgi:tetratricopeptide (TPR) repeat protein